MIYLDSAATTLEKPACVAKAAAWAIDHCSSPGRGGYPAGEKAAEILYRCREEAAEMFGVSNPEQVVLTSNATHGLNIAIKTLVKPGDTVLISGYEHNAVTRTLHSIPDIRIATATGPLFYPEIILASFARLLEEGADVVICTHVSNVFGYILPLSDIAALCRQYGVPLIVDASQSAGILPVSLAELGASFIAMPGHKGLYGPQGTGLLLCGTEPTPILHGGTGGASANQNMPDYLPDRSEAGTQNVCGAAGLLAGIRFVKRLGMERIHRHECKLRRRLECALSQTAGLRLYAGEGQSGVISLVVESMDCEWIGTCLARRTVAVRTGLHCAPLAHQTAGTIHTGTVRFSFSAFNYSRQVDYTVKALQNIISGRRVDT